MALDPQRPYTAGTSDSGPCDGTDSGSAEEASTGQDVEVHMLAAKSTDKMDAGQNIYSVVYPCGAARWRRLGTIRIRFTTTWADRTARR